MKKNTSYVCTGCKKQCNFTNKKDCEEAEKYCRSCCEVTLDTFIYGKNNKLCWSIDDTIHAHEDTLRHLHEIRKSGPFHYACYSKNDKESIRETKQVMLDYLLKELEHLKATAIEAKQELNKD